MSYRVPVNACLAALLMLASANEGWGCEPPAIHQASTPKEIRAFFAAQGKEVLTFSGYSGAGYEHQAAMLKGATELLGRHDPKRTIVNIGATAEGIGAVYQVAKQKGFQTTGIVSTQARDTKTALSPCVDIVFFVEDATWGGFVANSKQLSPTSQAMVEVSTELVAFGGGDVARDEMVVARRLGKRLQFFSADMNHALALAKAAKNGQPPPTDFRGAAEVVFGSGTAGQPPR